MFVPKLSSKKLEDFLSYSQLFLLILSVRLTYVQMCPSFRVAALIKISLVTISLISEVHQSIIQLDDKKFYPF